MIPKWCQVGVHPGSFTVRIRSISTTKPIATVVLAKYQEGQFSTKVKNSFFEYTQGSSNELSVTLNP